MQNPKERLSVFLQSSSFKRTLLSILTVSTFFQPSSFGIAILVSSWVTDIQTTHITFQSHFNLFKNSISTWNLLLSSPYLVLYCILLFPHPKPSSVEETFLPVILFLKKHSRDSGGKFSRRVFGQIQHCFDTY